MDAPTPLWRRNMLVTEDGCGIDLVAPVADAVGKLLRLAGVRIDEAEVQTPAVGAFMGDPFDAASEVIPADSIIVGSGFLKQGRSEPDGCYGHLQLGGADLAGGARGFVSGS